MDELTKRRLKTISSREVAEMMEIRHADLMKKIEKHTEILGKVTERNFSLSDLWILSSYKDKTGRNLKEYQVTKKGCEFLAHKTTGEKGDLFTIRYMDKFEEMELVQQQTIDMTELSPSLQTFKQIFDTMVEQEIKQKQMEKDIEGIKTSLDGIQNLISLSKDNWRHDVKDIINKIAYKTGTKHKVIWDEVYNELQTRFGVNLNTRLKNRKNNAINNGMSKSKAEKINKLDIIDEDKSLVEGLLIVTKDLALKYNIYQEDELVIND
jgi:phage regulator Rha-like protein